VTLRPRHALAAGAVLLVLAGCGGGGGSATGHGGGSMMGSGGMMGGAPGATTASPTTGSGATTAGEGAALFVSSGCGTCHRLAAAGTTGSVGPDLDRLHPSYDTVVRQVTSGGGGMPGFSGTLSAAQIRALARYVADAAG